MVFIDTMPRLVGFGMAKPHLGSIVVAVDHRVGDRALGDDADDVADPWPVDAAEDDGGAGAMAFQSGEHQAQEIVVPANHRAGFDKTFDQQVRIALGFAP